MKLIQEISDVRSKLINEENMKQSLNMLLKQKNVKNEDLKSEIINFVDIFEKSCEEMKWNKDKIVQKEIQIKTYKERLNKMALENEANLKLIESLKKLKNAPETKRSNIPDEELIPLQAKPFLFQEYIY